MNTVLWIVQILLALLYVTAGALKTFATAKAKEQLPWAKRHSDNFVRFVGAAELMGALGLLLPMLTGIMPWLTPVAALSLVLVQILAIFTEHLPAKEYKALPFNLVLLALAVFVAYGRFVVIPR
jgi:uncharacterized membrane protein YphA (DoxX/SURF4 family)